MQPSQTNSSDSPKTVLLIGLHGYTLHGEVLRRSLSYLSDRAPHVDQLYPDAPHTCSPESVTRLYDALGVEPSEPPHRTWWDASDDGSVYRGWEVSRDQVSALVDGGRASHSAVGLLGFSQGAMFAAAWAAAGARGLVAPVDFVILIAGRTPRADLMTSWFADPLPTPSLHVWGERDQHMASHASALADAFAKVDRRVTTWRGNHVVPSRGPGADAIVGFLSTWPR